MNWHEALQEVPNLVDPGVVDVKHHATDAGVAGVEPLSRCRFNDVVDLFALVERVKESGKRSQV